MASNPVQHRRTKHIEINIHFVREKVALGEVRVLHVPTSALFTDIFTKGLPTASFIDILSSLNIIDPDAATAGGGGVLEIFSYLSCILSLSLCILALQVLYSI
jgi:hypothetical protein